MSTRPPIQQLHQSGATPGQVPVWDAAGYWTPGGPVVTPCRAAFTASGGEQAISIGTTPQTNTEQVFINGLLKRWGVDYTISGSTITLTSPLSAGAVLLLIYGGNGACGVAVMTAIPTGFTRPVAVTRPVRRYHRIR